VQVTINGRQLKMAAGKSGWLECALQPADVKPGANEVGVALAPDGPKALKWLDLVIQVRH
jgi:hypothetical protein